MVVVGERLSRFIKSSSIAVHTFLGKDAVSKNAPELSKRVGVRHCGDLLLFLSGVKWGNLSASGCLFGLVTLAHKEGERILNNLVVQAAQRC